MHLVSTVYAHLLESLFTHLFYYIYNILIGFDIYTYRQYCVCSFVHMFMNIARYK
jgi:sterol desaturase/sphingolipid hydroxylase (fatty acid hydroxylase superfamily)